MQGMPVQPVRPVTSGSGKAQRLREGENIENRCGRVGRTLVRPTPLRGVGSAAAGQPRRVHKNTRISMPKQVRKICTYTLLTMVIISNRVPQTRGNTGFVQDL